MKRDGTGLKESGGEGIAGGGGRSVVTRKVVTRGVVTRKVVTRGVAWIHDLGVLQEEWLRGVCFAVFASQCLLRSACFAGLASQGLLRRAYSPVVISNRSLRRSYCEFFGRDLQVCVYQTLRVTVPR